MIGPTNFEMDIRACETPCMRPCSLSETDLMTAKSIFDKMQSTENSNSYKLK